MSTDELNSVLSGVAVVVNLSAVIACAFVAGVCSTQRMWVRMSFLIALAVLNAFLAVTR